MMLPRPAPDPPGPGQESVWDYPRPPRLEPTTAFLEIWLGGVRIAQTDRGYRVLETSHPPTYYLPREAFLPGAVTAGQGRSVCEFKGVATYWTLTGGDRTASSAAWSQEEPTPAFRAITGYLSVYPGRMDACRVDGELVTPQPGDFYAGWITHGVAGPFKGVPGSQWW